jgi:hypothetical protein
MFGLPPPRHISTLPNSASVAFPRSVRCWGEPAARAPSEQPVSARDGVGIVMIVIGVVLLVWSY